MRSLLALALACLPACKPGGTGAGHEVCAKAAAIFERCEDLGAGSSAEEKLGRSLAVDRWRALCRAVVTGETKQMMNDTLAAYHQLGDDERAGLKLQAECTAKATTCDEYRKCNE